MKTCSIYLQTLVRICVKERKSAQKFSNNKKAICEANLLGQ